MAIMEFSIGLSLGIVIGVGLVSFFVLVWGGQGE
jgi:hypothetical protein